MRTNKLTIANCIGSLWNLAFLTAGPWRGTLKLSHYLSLWTWGHVSGVTWSSVLLTQSPLTISVVLKNTDTATTLTEPTRCLSHWQDNVLVSIAVNVKVFTQNIQDACLGAPLLRAQGRHNTMQLLWCTQRICNGVHVPPLIGITRSYILRSKFKLPDLYPIHWRQKGGHKLVQKHSVKRKAYIKLKGTQGTQANRCMRRRMVVELRTGHQ